MKPQPDGPAWFEIRDVAGIASPGLVVYRDRVQENLRRMLAIAGEAGRLRPHIKTHKMREVIELQLAMGITKFKCATMAEAELAASTGVNDVLLAYQPVGPNPHRLADLMRVFPQTQFSVTCDDPRAVAELSTAVQSVGRARGNQARGESTVEVLLDLDVGQHRTGIPADGRAAEVYASITSLPGLRPGGLHVYDGHISDTGIEARSTACERAFAPVAALKDWLVRAGLPVPRVVAGGTPTFGFHAKRVGVECSPGTCVFWDAGYARKLPDLDFLPAALVLTRVVSKPGPNRLCLDLGHKAIGSEMPHPRVRFLNLEDAQAVTHSEEHLVVETAQSDEFEVGDCLYGVPWHICPTVALHSRAAVVQGERVIGSWKVAARDRQLTI